MIPTEYFQIFIYCMFFFGVIAYAALDGFDLGVGSLHLFLAKNDRERRLLINSIGPVWDGNTTWIVISGGILFAAFPKVFANLSSSLYVPTMLLLFGYMLRGTAIEFRSKHPNPKWRKFWDFAFFLASFILAIMVGLLLGTLIEGLPLTAQGEYLGSFWALLTPYSLLITLFGLSLFVMHGALYLVMKIEGEFHDKIRRYSKRLVGVFLFFWIIATTTTFWAYPYMVDPFFDYPVLWVFPLLSLSCIVGILYAVRKHRDGLAFSFSCFSIVFLFTLFIVGIFPNIVISTVSPETHSMTLYNSSASRLALIVITIISFIGFPLSFFYISYMHRVFKGKVKLDSTSY